MKRILILMLIISVILINVCNTSYATQDIKVAINGVEQTYDQNPVIINGRTLVPMRMIFESLGAKVEWNEEEQIVTAVKDFTSIKIGIGKKYATVNDTSIKLDASACIVNNRTLVPVRFVAESLGAIVKWNEAERKVGIIYEELFRKNIGFENISSFSDYILGGAMSGSVNVESGIGHDGKKGNYLKIEGFETKSHRFKIHDIFPEKYVGNNYMVSMWIMLPDEPSLITVGAYGITNSIYATTPAAFKNYEISGGKWQNIVFYYKSLSEVATMLGVFQNVENPKISPVIYIDDIEIICTKAE